MFYISAMLFGVNEPKHRLAILRRTIGLKQKEMADLAECAPATIQAIEYGKLPLSDKRAGLIAYQTGVDPCWLRSGLGPPKDCRGEPCSPERYEQHRASLFTPAQNSLGLEFDLILVRSCFVEAVERLAVLFTKAFGAQNRQNGVMMCRYKVDRATQELLQEMGLYKALTEDERFRWNGFKLARLPKKTIEPGYRTFLDYEFEQFIANVAGEELFEAMNRFIKATQAAFETKKQKAERTAKVKRHSPSRRP